MIVISLLVLVLFLLGNAWSLPCDPLALSEGTVCRCTATYCDTIDDIPTLTDNSVFIYTTNNDGKRLELTTHAVPETTTVPSDAIAIELDGTTHQKMLGFGGAVTDAATFVVGQLSAGAKQKLVDTYYSRSGGARYSMSRVPVGSSDFSRNSYSLVSNTDLSLSTFALRDDNNVANSDSKADFLISAQNVVAQSTSTLPSNSTLKEFRTFASIWSVPPFMKTCNRPPAPDGINSCGSGFFPWLYGRPSSPDFLFGALKNEAAVKQSYANYWLKFVQAYTAKGVHLWGATMQNEPDGNPVGNGWENTYYTAQYLFDTVVNYVAPKLKAAFPDFKIITGDDQYPEIPDHARLAASSNLIDGVGYHWYFSFNGGVIDTDPMFGQLIGGQKYVNNAYQAYSMNNKNGNKFLIMSEACTGGVDSPDVKPGSWERGYNYMTSILHEVVSGAAAWVDWNIALDMSGGPNHASNEVDAPVLVDGSKDEFYKQPMFYAMSHFSHFVRPGAVRLGIKNSNIGFIGSGSDNKKLEVVAFRMSETSTDCVLIIANDHLPSSLPIRGLRDDHTAVLVLPNGRKLVIEMEDQSFKTVGFKCPLFSAQLSGVDTAAETESSQMSMIVGVSSGFVAVFAVSALFFVAFIKKPNKSKLSQETTKSVENVEETVENAKRKSSVKHYVVGVEVPEAFEDNQQIFVQSAAKEESL